MPDYIKDPAFLQQFQADPQQELTPNQLLGFVANDPLLFAPGSRYDYSDSDNIILGLMDEAVTGGTYEAALSTFVTGPLSLTRTVLPANANLTTPYLHGYDIDRDSGSRRRQHVPQPRAGLGVRGDAVDPTASSTRSYARMRPAR